MRKLLISMATTLLVAITAFSQAPIKETSPTSITSMMQKLMVGKTLYLPKVFTPPSGTPVTLFNSPDSLGAVVFCLQDSMTYTYVGAGVWKITEDNRYALKSTTITAAGNGLVGGGSLAGNRTFSLDFTYLDSRYPLTGSVDSMLGLRVRYTDTATMLSGYVLNNRFLDTASALQSRIQTKQPLGSYLTFADSTTILAGRWLPNRSEDSISVIRALANSKGTGSVTSVGTNDATGINGGTITTIGTLAIDTINISTRLWRQKGVDSLNSLINDRVKYSDTASMLSNRLKISDTAAMLAPFVQYSDTASMLVPFVQYSDTAYMLTPYYRTATATSALATKLNISDTSTMLSNYRRTSTLIENSDLRNNSITINGSATALGGSASVGTVTSVSATGGTGISVTGSPITGSGTLTITNTAPDQTVSLTNGGNITITGTYPNFTLTNGITNNNQLTNGAGYLTANQTINFSPSTSGDVTGTSSGGTSLSPVLVIGAGKVTNTMLAGSIDYAKMNAATVPTWNQNTTGNAATATTATNWSGSSALGSYAYRSSGLAELSGATFTGALNGTTATFDKPLYVGGFSGGYRAVSIGATGGDYGSTGYGFIYGTSSDTYSATDLASRLKYQAGGFQFQTAPSGISGNTITWSTPVTISNSGALNGTSAAFSGDVTAGGTSTVKGATPFFRWLNASDTRLAYIQHDATNLVYNADVGSHVFNQAINGTSLSMSGGGSFGSTLRIGGSLKSWDAFEPALQIKTMALGSSGQSNGRIFTNTYYDGNYRYQGTGTATMYEADGGFFWGTAASGVADGLISWVERMRLTTAGNLLIKAPTDNGTDALQVAGSGLFTTNLTIGTGVYATPQETLNVLNRAYFVDAKYQWMRVGMSSDRAVISTDWFSGAGGATPNLAFLTGNIDRLVINGSTGAATFSSSVTATNFQSTNGRTYFAPGASRIENSNLVLDFGIDATAGYMGTNYYSGGTYKKLILYAGGTTNQLTLNTDGTIVAGYSVTATAFYESSDLRQKTVHTTLKSSDGIDAIQYTFKPSNSEKWGYGAQQVQPILPYAVSKGEDGFFKVDYTTVHTYKIAQLEKRIAELEKQLKK